MNKQERELMQQALDALNRSDCLGWQFNIPLIKALRARLAQPEQEPVAWMDAHDPTEIYYRKPPQGDVVPLYLAPPKEIK